MASRNSTRKKRKAYKKAQAKAQAKAQTQELKDAEPPVQLSTKLSPKAEQELRKVYDEGARQGGLFEQVGDLIRARKGQLSKREERMHINRSNAALLREAKKRKQAKQTNLSEVDPRELSRQVRANMRRVSNARRNYTKTKNAALDVSDVLQGRDRRKDKAGRLKKRFYEKDKFRRDAAVAVGGLALSGAYLLSKPGKSKSAKALKVLNESLDKETRLSSPRKDWEVSGLSKKTAVVRAPGGRRRNRREKTWSERKANRDNLALASVVGATLATALVSRRSAKRAIQREKDKYKNLIKEAKNTNQNIVNQAKNAGVLPKPGPYDKTTPEKFWSHYKPVQPPPNVRVVQFARRTVKASGGTKTINKGAVGGEVDTN